MCIFHSTVLGVQCELDVVRRVFLHASLDNPREKHRLPLGAMNTQGLNCCLRHQLSLLHRRVVRICCARNLAVDNVLLDVLEGYLKQMGLFTK
jgi:hypothetical protein